MTTARSESRLGDRFRALIRTARIARQRLTVPAAPVQPGMIGILSAIGSTGGDAGCHPKELAVRCGLDASTISRAVTTLVARGLVRRSADPTDRRACILTLTGAGRAALSDLERQQADLLAAVLRGWTAAEIEAFVAALARFVDDTTAYLDRTSSVPATTAGGYEASDRKTSTLEATL
ncbi:MarR family winged helix-turn-helix transcriptional regulator [Planosporangium sp. 12N6]|uniref:MarR family winged helix-turn-helix transcriptional regulator n=1 Tax=Planosporangium spinosum TaxID=3402278 RepID=UPI003CE7BC13